MSHLLDHVHRRNEINSNQFKSIQINSNQFNSNQSPTTRRCRSACARISDCCARKSAIAALMHCSSSPLAVLSISCNEPASHRARHTWSCGWLVGACLELGHGGAVVVGGAVAVVARGEVQHSRQQRPCASQRHSHSHRLPMARHAADLAILRRLPTRANTSSPCRCSSSSMRSTVGRPA